MCILASASLLVSGVVFVVYGAIYVSYHAQRIENVEGLRFVPNAAANPSGYAAFLASPTLGVQGLEPQTRSYYVFNITNIDAVVAGTAVPHVQQVGPYVYALTSTKNNVRFNGSTVMYSVGSNFAELPTRSNGSSSDVVYTVNTSYARTLAKLGNAGFSERLLVAAHAQTQLSAYAAYLEGPMLAFTKQRLALPYLATMAVTTRTNALPAALSKFQAQVASQTLPQNLLRLIATTRQAYIPTLLRPMYEAFLVNYVPMTLSSHLAALQVQSVPRVLSNVQARLAVEAVPTMLTQRQAQLRSTAVPVVLSTILSRLPTYISFPYFARDMMEEACLEAVPSMLSTIKAGVVQAYVDQGASAATAQQNTVLQWLSAAGPWTNLDAMVGGNPIGQPRYGFELRSTADPSLASLALSTDVGNLLLAATTNLDFSLLDYTPTDTNHGFGLWKQVVAMNEAAITALIAGVNNEIALPANYLTRAQVLGVRGYILSWSKGAMLHRDRQRYWATAYAQRTAGSANEPSVDIDWVTSGVQTGFPLASTNLGLSDAQCARLWDATVSPSFLTPTGYVTWTAAGASDSAAVSALQSTFGLSTSQLTGVLAWIQALTSSASVKTNAIRHWGLGGTCPSPFNNVSICATYQLEPHLGTSVSGWELPNAANLVFSEALVAYLWDATQTFSFLHLASGYTSWVNVLLLPNGLSSLTTSLAALNLGAVSEDHVRLVATWLENWSRHPLLLQAMDQTWRDPTTFPFLPATTLASLTTYLMNRPTLSAAAAAYLNSPSSTYAALNTAGYAVWMSSPSSALVSSMLAAINAQLPTFCTQLLGGANSALFATPLAGSCGVLTAADMTALQTYVQNQKTDAYMLQALREQWRCGLRNWNLEPYRAGLQVGWELCRNSSCNLSLVNGTSCVVPSAAMNLWDSANALSFLKPSVYQTTWLAAQSADAATSAPAKAAIAAGLGQASWLPWMDVISQWLVSWATLDYTIRDVLGLWLKAACTVPTVVSQTPVTTTASTASCVPSTTTTSDAVQYTNLVVGGRPTTYFASNFAETSYSDMPNIAVSTVTTVVTCTPTTTTTTTTTTVTNGPLCLMSDVTPGLPLLQTGFELGAVTSTLSMNLVQLFLWNPATPVSFLNMTALNTLWVPAATDATKVAALVALLPGASLADVTTVVQWLRAWRTNQLMSLFAQTQWINPSTSVPPFNLDPSGASTQTGFELRFTSTDASTYPSLVQAQYLWSPSSAYSFLDTATGFPTWVQAYAGSLPASEAFVDLLARSPTTTTTTQTASVSAVATLQSATGLSTAQIQTVSKWLVQWADHPFLWSVLLSQWISKTTVFASTPSTLNLAALDASGAMTSLTGFELTVSTRVTPAQARQLWNVANATSFLNPNLLILWCFCHPQITAACPHLSDATGQLPAAANASAASALTRYAGLAPGFQMTSAPTATLAQSFVSLATGLAPADVTAVARWLFEAPQASFYQFLLQSQWATAGLPLYPKNAGFELAYIFDLTATTPRNATAALLLPNTPTPCAPIGAVLAAQLWQPTSTTSFLHSVGLSAWLGGTIVVPGLAACQKTQVSNWLLSWQRHPFLRQFVEYSWYTTPLPCTQSLFGCNRGFELALPTSIPSPTTLPTLGAIAAIVWDAQSPLSFLHPTGGLVWKTLLLGACGSSFANGTCAPATGAPASASSYLVGQLASALGVSALVSDVRTCVYLIGQVWLLQLLDNPGFVSYVLAATGGAPTLLALPMQQFVNASVLSINASMTDVGIFSQFDSSISLQWNATSQELVNVTQPPLVGIPELSVYCARAPSVFGVTPNCALSRSYTLDYATARGLMLAFNDMTVANLNGLAVARGVVVLDTFLAQPFLSPDACAAAVSRMTSLFPALVASTARCSSVGPSYLLIVPGVAPFELTALAPILDVQAYLKYTASVFGYASSGGLFVQTSVQTLLWQNTAARRLRPTATTTLSNLDFGAGDVLSTAVTANVSVAPASQAVQTYTFNTDSRVGFYGCLLATNGEPDANNCTTSDGSVFATGATPATLALRWQSQSRDVNYRYAAEMPWIGVPTRRYVEAVPDLTNVSHLYDDLPVLSSSPHLYNVTSTLPFATGLAPNAKSHTMLLDIEPVSGTALHRRDAWMLSVATGPTWLWHQRVQVAYVPLTWVLQEQAIPAASASLYRDLTAPGPMAPEKVAIWELVLGLAFVGLGIYALRLLSRARFKDTLLIKPVAEMPPIKDADVHATDDALPDKTKAI